MRASHGLVLALAAAYVTAQALAVTHDVGPEGHPAGEVCALCVTAGTLGAADVAPTRAALLPEVAEAAVSAGVVLALASRRAIRRARGPPAAC